MQYTQALRKLGARVSEGQRRMLAAHAAAPAHQLDDAELARAAGQRHRGYTNLHYGRLGHAIVRALRSRREEHIWTRVIADDRRNPRTGRVEWTLFPEVAGAVEGLGWKMDLVAPDPLADVESQLATLPKTIREALIEARLGQGRFRQCLISEWGTCAVTGCEVLGALKASHIKPWRHSSNEERLDPNNGVLLIATLDALFDAGLITFDRKGLLLCSSRLPGRAYGLLGLKPGMRLRKLDKARQRYLEWHRKHVFAG